VLQAPRRLGLEALELPPPGPGEVLVEVQACGVCGSNLHGWANPEHTVEPGTGARPGAAGHEVVAAVRALGPGTPGLRTGDIICVEPNLAGSCGECPRCEEGAAWFCRNRRSLPVWGFADEMLLSARGAVAVPAGLPTAVASLTEPLACGVHALRQSCTAAAQAGRLDGIRVVVVGAGVTGLLVLAAARWLGAAEVSVLARHRHQAAAAEALGAGTVVLAADADAESRLRRQRPQLVVEAVGGRFTTLATALAVVDRQGEVVVLGLFDQPQQVDVRRAVLREVRMFFPVTYGSSNGRTDFSVALDILAADAGRFAGLITHRFALADVQQAFQCAQDKRTGALRVLVSP